jgi:hypothetical protein
MSRTVDWHTSSRHSSLFNIIAVDAIPLEALCSLSIGAGGSASVGLGVDTEITSVDVRLFALVAWESVLDELLVCSQDGLELGSGDVVEEDAFTEFTVGNGESLLAVSGFPDVRAGSSGISSM